MVTCLSPRDQAILQHLREKVCLTVAQVHRLCFDGLSRDSAYKAVATLKRKKFVRGVPYNFGRLGKLEDLLFLTKAGFAVVAPTGETYKPKTNPSLVADYAHRVAIIDYWISLELDCRNSSRHSLAGFFPEFRKLPNGEGITLKADLANGERLQVRNDALFILRDDRTGLEHLFLLEIDRGTMPLRTNPSLTAANQANLAIRSNLATKIAKIQNVFDHWPLVIDSLGDRFRHFQGAKVVVVTDTPQRMLTMLRVLPFRPPYRDQSAFLFSHFRETDRGALTCRYAVPDTTGFHTNEGLIAGPS